MRVLDRCGRLLVTNGCGQLSLEVGDPGILNPDTGERMYMMTLQLNGVTSPFLVDATPKVQDDDDGLWRNVYWKEIGGVPTFYLSDTADDIRGYELFVLDISDGNIRKMRSRKINGIPSWYFERIS